MTTQQHVSPVTGMNWNHVDHELSRTVLNAGGTREHIAEAISFATKSLTEDVTVRGVEANVYERRAKCLDIVRDAYGDNDLPLTCLALQQFWNT